MADQPKSFREVNITLGHLWKVVLGLVGILGAILATIAAIYVQGGDVKTQVVALGTKLDASVAAIDKRLAGLERGQEQTRDHERQVLLALGRVAGSQVAVPLLVYVSDRDVAFIRQVLKVPPVTGDLPTFSIGAVVPDDASKPLPVEIVDKLPQLKGVRFAVDATNAVALIDPRSGRTFAII